MKRSKTDHERHSHAKQHIIVTSRHYSMFLECSQVLQFSFGTVHYKASTQHYSLQNILFPHHTVGHLLSIPHSFVLWYIECNSSFNIWFATALYVVDSTSKLRDILKRRKKFLCCPKTLCLIRAITVITVTILPMIIPSRTVRWKKL